MHKQNHLIVKRKKKKENNPSLVCLAWIYSDYTKLNCTVKYLLWELVYGGSIHVQQRISAGQ